MDKQRVFKMSEELLQRGLDKNPEKIGKWDFYNIGSTTVKSLKEYGIIRDIDYGAIESKKVDAIITQKKNVIAVIEYKYPTEFKTERQKKIAINQEIEVAKKIGSKLLIATDTLESVWVNALNGDRILDEDNNKITVNFDSKNEKVVELIEKINYSINENNSSLKPKRLVNPTDLARQIWQDIWSVSGATPENCLYTFVELFIFKYLSDLGILNGIFSFDYLVENYKTNSEEEVLENYVTSIRPRIKTLFPMNTLDNTTIINGTIFVSKDQKAVKGYSTVFKKILYKFENYGKLDYIDHDFKSKLFESFLKESISKKNWGQFFTPLKVVKAIVQMAKSDIKDDIKMCDPACGVGKFLLESVIDDLNYFYEVNGETIVPKIELYGFDKGFDKDEQKTIILAKANMLIYFSDLIKDNPSPTKTKQFAELFNKTFTLKTNSILGTLSEPVIEKYDLILTNPPYVTSGSSNLKEEIKKDSDLKKYYKINALGVEGLFMEWIVRALKPKGKAFVIVPDGIFNRQNDKNLREFIRKECFIDGIISLPTKTFFSTPKKTYILCLTKKSVQNSIQTDPVFTYLVSEIGESRDVYRFDIEQDDLTEAVILFNFFKNNKHTFDKYNRDKRCKIQPIEKFEPDGHWSIDRWWSKEEQIELGIRVEDNVVNILEFSELVNDISETLNDISDMLKEVASEKKNNESKNVNYFEEIHLSDLRFFELFIGKRLLKKDLINISGNIPIYSANVKNPISFHNSSNISDFNNNFVLWGIDGDFEFNVIPKNQPFVSTDHCGAIRILNDDLLPEYLMLQLYQIKYKYGFDRELRASLKNMRGVVVKVPFDNNGNIDIKKQKEIIEKFEYVIELKEKVGEYQKIIDELNVEVNSLNYSFKSCAINDKNVFQLVRGKRITRSTIDQNKGAVPVYSSSKSEDSVLGYISEKYLIDNNLILFKEPSILFNLDGSVGYCFVRNDPKYSFIDVVSALIPKFDNVQLEFLLYKLREEIHKTGANYQSKLYFNKIDKYGIKIDIPVDVHGDFDLKMQEEIAETYRKIEAIKEAINAELDKIQEVDINLE